VYQTRKNGPYCVSLKASGLRVSGTNQKLVFGKLEDAAEFGTSVSALYALLGFPGIRRRSAQGVGVRQGEAGGTV